MLRKTLKEVVTIFILGLFLVSVEVLAQSANPPNNNAPAPLNVSSSGQSKSGGLILNTGGATNGLIVDKGNVGIGTANPTVKLQVVGDIKTSGSIVGSGSPASDYGATAVWGEKNSWGGLNFKSSSGSNLGTLMVHKDYQGFYNDSDNNWDWYFKNGVLQVGSIPWSQITGAPANPAESDTLQSVTDRGNSTTKVIGANAGVSVDGYTAISDGDLWHNTYGNGGWYNGTYAGGWYMEDTTWVRSYNNKGVYTGGQIRADSGFCIGGSCLTSWPSSAGINVYSCPTIWEGNGQTNCKGQLSAGSSCAYDNGTGGWFNYSCSYVGKLAQ